MNIFVYIRPWNKDFYSTLIDKAFEGAKVTTYSDYRGVGAIWTGDFIYSSKFDGCTTEFAEVNHEIVTRCRYLRSLDRKRADVLAKRTWNGINSLFADNRFDLVIIPAVDNYVMDIIDRVAKCNNVPVIAAIQNFVKGYSRFTVKGERVDLNREITREEVDNVYDMLTLDAYKPAFSLNREKSTSAMVKGYLRRKVIEDLYYPIRKIVERDKNNYMYDYSVFERGWSNYLGNNIGKYWSRLSDVTIDEESIYIPLHFTPEATVDYWCDNAESSYYEEELVKIIHQINGSHRVLLKEHPAMVGWRNSEFYQRLKAHENVSIIHPYENSNQLLKKVNTVVVHTGSVGVEALLRGKRVISMTHNYYSDLHPNISVVNSVQESDLTKEIVGYDGHAFINGLLKGLFPYSMGDGRHMEKQLETVDALVPWVKLWWEQYGEKYE